MKRRSIFKAVPFVISLIGTTTYAQNNPHDIGVLFDLAAAKHKRELTDLWKSRGAPIITLPDVSHQNIIKVLATGEHDFENGRGEAIYPHKTAVIFYSYDRETLQTWLVNEREIQAYHRQIISEQQINETIAQLRQSLRVNSAQLLRTPHPRSFEVVATPTHSSVSLSRAIADITEILIPTPIANKLDTVKHLIVVPVLGFGTVPYAILQPFKDDSDLIDRMSISIASSLYDLGTALYSWNLEMVYSAPLLVGNPYFPESSKWAVEPLPEAEQEVKAVAKIMQATPLIGKEATKDAVVERAKQSSLLYFATHGVASHENPLLGGFLMLSAQQLEAGWWTAKEIQNTKLKAEMAVLSACQTGLGKVHDAGMIGLARAFQIAGVPRVIMSLWNVDDGATNQLMQAFVKHLDRHIPAEALRQAMLELRDSYPKPSEWASFVVFGTPR